MSGNFAPSACLEAAVASNNNVNDTIANISDETNLDELVLINRCLLVVVVVVVVVLFKLLKQLSLSILISEFEVHLFFVAIVVVILWPRRQADTGVNNSCSTILELPLR